MKFKPDWPEAKEQLSRLWHGQSRDRPCIAIEAPRDGGVPAPERPPEPWQQWLDPDWVTRAAVARCANTWWGGEALPSYLLMGGWCVCFGATPRFDWTTIWHEPIDVDFNQPPRFGVDWEDPWVEKIGAVTRAVARAAGRDDFALGQPVILPASDLLAGILGTEKFLLSLSEHPEWMREALRQIGEAVVEYKIGFRERFMPEHEFWYGNAGWMPFWAPEPVLSMQSDVSCMMSPAMYEEFVVPELDAGAQRFGPIWYHLDGRDARQHLPALLAHPGLRVLQYTPTPTEPPNGPDHLAFYRQVQHAGKIVHITVDRSRIEPLARQLDPQLLMIQTNCDTPAEGEQLLAAARRWMRGG